MEKCVGPNYMMFLSFLSTQSYMYVLTLTKVAKTDLKKICCKIQVDVEKFVFKNVYDYEIFLSSFNANN